MSEDATQYDINAENNERAVVLSDEVTFLEGLLESGYLTDEGAQSVIDRLAAVRDAMATDNAATPKDEPDEGTPLPDEAEDIDDDEPDED